MADDDSDFLTNLLRRSSSWIASPIPDPDNPAPVQTAVPIDPDEAAKKKKKDDKSATPPWVASPIPATGDPSAVPAPVVPTPTPPQQAPVGSNQGPPTWQSPPSTSYVAKPIPDWNAVPAASEKKATQASLPPAFTRAQVAAGLIHGFEQPWEAADKQELGPPTPLPAFPASEWTANTPAPQMGPEGVPQTVPETAATEHVPLPRPRPREADGSESLPSNGPSGDKTTPQGAAPTGYNLPGQADQRAGMLDGLGDFGSKIMQGLHDNSNFLLAMGGGMLGAPSWATGLSRGLTAAVPAGQLDLRMQQQMGGQQAMYNALRAASPSISHDLAIAGSQNPKLGEQLLTQYAIAPTMKVEPVKSTSMFGGETTRLLAYDPTGRRPSYYINPGEQPGAGGGAPGGAGGGPGGGPMLPDAGGQGGGQSGGPQSPYFAPGISEQNLDQTKVGDPYLNQFAPMVKQDVISYLHGAFNPQGRGQGYGQAIKSIADKYGADIGMPADSAKIGQRQKFESEMADPNKGWGGRKAGLQQSLEHFDKVVNNVYGMGLHAGPGIWGGEAAAAIWNRMNATNPDVKGIINENASLATPFARELGKMAGGSSVGEAEKLVDSVSGGFRSKQAAVGALKGIRDYIQGSMDTMQHDRDDLFPDERYRPQGSEFVGPREKAFLDDIDHKIAIMEGKEKAPRATSTQAQAAPTATGPGGRKIILQDGRWVDAQTGKPLQ